MNYILLLRSFTIAQDDMNINLAGDFPSSKRKKIIAFAIAQDNVNINLTGYFPSPLWERVRERGVR